MIDLLRAEQIKLTTIRSPYWCVAVAALLSIGVTGLFAAVLSNSSEISRDSTSGSGVNGTALSVVLVGLQSFAVIVLMIMAVIGVTSEYRFSTIRATFLAVPRRPVALIAKTVVYLALTLVTMIVLTLICLSIAVAGVPGVSFGNSAVIRFLWGLPVYAALCVLLAQGVALLLRQTAGAISVVLVWILLLESIVGWVPKVRDVLSPLMPFANGSRFLAGAVDGDGYYWNSSVSLVYFAVWAVAVFAVGVWVATRRDA